MDWIFDDRSKLTLPDLKMFTDQDNTTTLLPESNQQKCDWNYIYQEIR